MINILQGDWIEQLRTLPDESVQCIVTSPPYWGLRDYGMPGQLGVEKTPIEYVNRVVDGFRQVKRVLRSDGVCWLNLGDCYSGGGNGGGGSFAKDGIRSAEPGTAKNKPSRFGKQRTPEGLKAKDLVGIPWMTAFALRSEGWYLRQEIIWSKPNPMPESVTDRCTRAHEQIFMLTKASRYFYNHEAIKEQPSPALLKQIAEGYNGQASKDFISVGVQDASSTKTRIIEGMRKRIDKQRGHSRRHNGFNDRWDNLTVKEQMACGSNKRSVWTVAPANFKEAHFATFPPDLIKPCILAGTRPGDTVLDPFGGSGTTGQVALELGRKAILIELNPEYAALAKQRCDVTPGLQLA